MNTALAAMYMGFRSEMGLPVTMLPPTPAVLRIWLPALQELRRCQKDVQRQLACCRSAVDHNRASPKAHHCCGSLPCMRSPLANALKCIKPI